MHLQKCDFSTRITDLSEKLPIQHGETWHTTTKEASIDWNRSSMKLFYTKLLVDFFMPCAFGVMVTRFWNKEINTELINNLLGHAMAQAVSRQPLITEARVRAAIGPCGICGGQNGTGTGFSPSSSVFPCQYYSTVALHIQISSGGRTIVLWWPQFRDIVSPHRHEQQQQSSTTYQQDNRSLLGQSYLVALFSFWTSQ
jgi:hypothetical protein